MTSDDYPNLSFSYDSITNKYTIENDVSISLDLSASTSIATALGFTREVFEGTSIVSNTAVKMFEKNHLFIRTSLPYLAVFDSSGSRSSVIAKIPIDTLAGGINYYDGSRQPLIALASVDLSTFDVDLTYDQSGDLVDLNGLEWDFTIMIVVYHSDVSEKENFIKAHNNNSQSV